MCSLGCVCLQIDFASLVLISTRSTHFSKNTHTHTHTHTHHIGKPMEDFDELEGLDDLYALLGVTRAASKAEIRKAFHKLSLRLHPDRNKSEHADGQFKLINKAHQILSDPTTRAIYDREGAKGVRLYETRAASAEARERRREAEAEKSAVSLPAVELDLDVSLEELYVGAERQVPYVRRFECYECGGTGKGDQASSLCRDCGGSGFVARSTQLGGVWVTREVMCGACAGQGRTRAPAVPCSRCGGEGSRREERTVRVVVKPGQAEGDVISVKLREDERTDSQWDGATGAEVIVTLRQSHHPLFMRQGQAGDGGYNGQDLVVEQTVPLVDALVMEGRAIWVPHLLDAASDQPQQQRGETRAEVEAAFLGAAGAAGAGVRRGVLVPVEGVIRPQQEVRVLGEGMPAVVDESENYGSGISVSFNGPYVYAYQYAMPREERSRQGDLLVRFLVAFPTEAALGSRQQQLIAEALRPEAMVQVSQDDEVLDWLANFGDEADGIWSEAAESETAEAAEAVTGAEAGAAESVRGETETQQQYEEEEEEEEDDDDDDDDEYEEEDAEEKEAEAAKEMGEADEAEVAEAAAATARRRRELRAKAAARRREARARERARL